MSVVINYPAAGGATGGGGTTGGITAGGRNIPAVYQDSANGTVVINTDAYDVVQVVSRTTTIANMSTGLVGSPVRDQSLIIEITGTGSTAITSWGTSFEASTVALPTTTSGTNKLSCAFLYNADTSKWRCMAVA